MQFDVTIILDKHASTVDLFPLREDADAKIHAKGFFKYREIYPFWRPRDLNLVLDFCKELDLLVDPTYLE